MAPGPRREEGTSWLFGMTGLASDDEEEVIQEIKVKNSQAAIEEWDRPNLTRRRMKTAGNKKSVLRVLL